MRDWALMAVATACFGMVVPLPAGAAALSGNQLVGTWAFGRNKCTSEQHRFLANETYIDPSGKSFRWNLNNPGLLKIIDLDAGTTDTWFPDTVDNDFIEFSFKGVLVRC
jgi:hypothetical protein